MHTLQKVTHSRLPLWALPKDWPRQGSHTALADIEFKGDKIDRITPSALFENSSPWAASAPALMPSLMQTHDAVLDLKGALVLPGLMDAHTHIDKTLTLERIGEVKPGLLNAIQAMMLDRAQWSPSDIRSRATQALQWAHAAGVCHLRTHCDWWEPKTTPLAWEVIKDLATEWHSRIQVSRSALIPLNLFKDLNTALELAKVVSHSNAPSHRACLGGFIHTSNWDPQALKHLFEAAQRFELDVDLHVDEELQPSAQGLQSIATLVTEMKFHGRVVCGHTCALAQKSDKEALGILDQVAQSGLTLVTLPVTNLWLQDATPHRTPRLRGMTLIKEARARGIPVLMGSDNVQDPFCAMGSYDPLEAMIIGTPMGQLGQAFDHWSQSICQTAWLQSKYESASAHALQPGAQANLVIFTQANATGFPSQTLPRVIVRDARVLQGTTLF
jgi:cytosine/creatinine deaminase